MGGGLGPVPRREVGNACGEGVNGSPHIGGTRVFFGGVADPTATAQEQHPHRAQIRHGRGIMRRARRQVRHGLAGVPRTGL